MHYIDGETVLSNKGKTIIPMGMEIRKRRELMNVTKDKDVQYDKFFVTSPSRVKTDEEKQIFKKELIKLWMLEDVVDVLVV